MPKPIVSSSTVTEDYLAGYGGSCPDFLHNLGLGQRLGQAFFNALSFDDQHRLRGQLVDPFYKDNREALYEAIEWLLDTEPRNKE